jgi:hypothetical protein
MIENLLLQQVLLYTHDRLDPTHYPHSPPEPTSPVWIRRETPQKKRSSKPYANEHLVLTSSRHKTNYDEEPTLCLIESNPDEQKSSSLIETILFHYNQCKDKYTRFDQNLIDLLLKRNRDRNNLSSSANSGVYPRLQWLAIGLVIDRFFFYMYFTATFVSYFVTLWLIPFSHPNLTINIQSL